MAARTHSRRVHEVPGLGVVTIGGIRGDVEQNDAAPGRSRPLERPAHSVGRRQVRARP